MIKNYFSILMLLAAGIISGQVSPVTPLLNVSIQTPISICNPGSCTELFAEYMLPKTTTNYIVENMQYGPSFPFVGGTVIPPSAGDDLWSPIITLPFNFCFYGNNFNQMVVGTNGVVSFNLEWNPGTPGYDFCPWSFATAIPNTNFPIKNAIYGVYQDNNISSPPVTNPAVQQVNYYLLDTGVNAAPNRVFVANFNELPQYQCNNSVGLQTSQIVLHEGTNIIEVFVKNRTACNSWQSGAGVIGLQNADGTLATVPPGRNTGIWSATNEAWRFTPNGAPLAAQLSWFADGVLIPSSENPLPICPTAEHVYSAQVTYNNCGNDLVVSDEYSDPIIAPPLMVNNPLDISVCLNNTGIYTADMTGNTEIILQPVNPQDFEVSYYENMVDAENAEPNNINDPSNYTFTENKTIYARIEDFVTTGCHNIRPFDLIILPAVTPPTGNSHQDFTNGQMLSDLVVSGENIIWYDAATGGNILPSNTLLQNGATYFAAQTQSGCESRNIQTARLAVTVNLVLANQVFNNSTISVFPNPANNVLNVSYTEDLKSIVIYNAVGQTVSAQYPQKKEVKFDISALPAGIYFVRINSETKQQTVKIIKE